MCLSNQQPHIFNKIGKASLNLHYNPPLVTRNYTFVYLGVKFANLILGVKEKTITIERNA